MIPNIEPNLPRHTHTHKYIYIYIWVMDIYTNNQSSSISLRNARLIIIAIIGTNLSNLLDTPQNIPTPTLSVGSPKDNYRLV